MIDVDKGGIWGIGILCCHMTGMLLFFLWEIMLLSLLENDYSSSSSFFYCTIFLELKFDS